MRRRDFIKAIPGSITAWPLVARAQQPKMPVIGLLNGQSADSYAYVVAALRKGLSETGYVEGQNLLIEYRWGEGHNDRLPALAADLVRRQVTAIVCGGTVSATLAAKAVTSVIPIVFTTGADPVKLGLVASINRPGGNITGVAFLVTQLNAKRLELLHQLLPQVTTVAAAFNLNNPASASSRRETEDAGRAIGLKLQVLTVSSQSEIDSAFVALAENRAGAVLFDADAFFNSNRKKIVALARRYAVPAIYELREYVADGGLMSYGTSITEAYRQAGIYIGRILKGEKPAELPVLQSTKFELVINLKTAKTLGITVPQTMLVAADDLIE